MRCRSTLAANVQGLRVAPLGPTIAAKASKLRAAGAEVVIVAAHAGGRCDRFDQPADLSSCDAESEIFQVARSLPHGLVDVIAAGHTHGGLAHQVDGIGIIQPFSRGQAFGRVDVVFDRRTRSVARIQLFAPRQICASRSVTGTASPPDRRADSTKDEPSRPIRPSSRRWRRRSSAFMSSRRRRSASPLMCRFVESATSARRSEISLPRRSATRCRARTCGHQQRGARSLGGPPRWPAHLRTALRRVPVRQSHRADHVDRRRARSVGGRRDPAGPSRLRLEFQASTCGRVAWRTASTSIFSAGRADSR